MSEAQTVEERLHKNRKRLVVLEHCCSGFLRRSNL